MSSKKSKRTHICPGCKISAEFHSFGPLGKHCEGLYPQEDEDNATPVTPATSQQESRSAKILPLKGYLDVMFVVNQA